MTEQREANEMFYLDDAGNKQDAELHNAIINPVDFPIDEKIMGPIRARNRAAYLDQQKAKTRSVRWHRIKAKAERLLARGKGNVTTLVKIKERAEARLENGQNGLYRGWNEQDHPRDPAGSPTGGQFTGGGGPEGSGKPASGGPGAGATSDGQPPRTFSRESPTDAQRSRDVVAIWRSETSGTFYEHGGSGGAKTFHNAITRAKTGEFGASVHVHEPDEYKGMRLFTAPDGKSGFALDGDNIVSLFKYPGSMTKGVAAASLALATEQGGRRLDCFDTALPSLYARSGFKAVARLKWNETYKPDGWDKQTYKEFNSGEPDVVFMVHDAAGAKPYKSGDGATVKEYDDGTAAQRKALGFVDANATNARWINASPVRTIEDIQREAPKAQAALVEVGQQIADKYGLEFKDPGPKTKTPQGVRRVIEKANERGVSLAAVTDTARATFLVNHPQQTDQIIAELAKHFEVAPEPWRVTDMNYGDRALNVRLPNGVIAEVQMLHPDMAWAKSPDGGGGHDLYKISREAAPAGVRPDPVKFADAMAKQRELYGKVYEGLSDDWKAAFGRSGKPG